MDRRVTSPTWGPPLPCKQAFNECQSTSEPKKNLFPGFFYEEYTGRIQRDQAKH